MVGGKENQIRKDDMQGFTLLEVLIAIFIATVGLLSLSSMQASAIKGNGASNERTRAVYLSQSMMERIANGSITSTEVFGYVDTASVVQDTILESGVMNGLNFRGNAGGPFDLQWKVSHHTQWSRRVDTTVSWRSIMGGKRYVRLATFTRGTIN